MEISIFCHTLKLFMVHLAQIFLALNGLLKVNFDIKKLWL